MNKDWPKLKKTKGAKQNWIRSLKKITHIYDTKCHHNNDTKWQDNYDKKMTGQLWHKMTDNYDKKSQDNYDKKWRKAQEETDRNPLSKLLTLNDTKW